MAFVPSDTWDSILNRLGSPANWVLTKEGYSVINAYITSREFIMLANFYQFLASLSTNTSFLNILLKYIVIRGVGSILIQNKQVSLNAIISALQIQKDMYVALVNVLNTLTNTIPSVAFNPVANAKWAGILASVLTALAATGTEIGNLKNDIRAILNQDIFCLTPCSTFERLTLRYSTVEDIREQYVKILTDLKELESALADKDTKGANRDPPTPTPTPSTTV